ncbi:MAG: TIM barrel protein [Candidatus Bipolaricaulota bacterium]
MNVQLGINGATIPSSDLLTGIHVARAAGFSLYEPRVPKLLEANTPEGRRAAQRALADEGLAWLPLNGLENVFALPLDQIQQAARDVCELASGFGIRQVIAVPGAAGHDVSLSEAHDTIGTLKAIAASHEVEFLYEFIGFSHYAFPSLEQAREVASATTLLLVLDTFHLAVSGTTAETLQHMDAAEIGLIHLSDAIVGDRAISTICDEDRVLPGEGRLPLQDYLGVFAGIRFSGPVSVEVFHPKYESIGPGVGAREARARASEALMSAGLDPN